MSPVHRGRDQELNLGVFFARLVHDRAELGQDGLSTVGHWRRRSIFETGEEIGDARQDADVRLGSQLRQGLGQDLDVAARHQLGGLHQRVRPTVDLIQMATDIRIPDDGEAARHLEE